MPTSPALELSALAPALVGGAFAAALGLVAGRLVRDGRPAGAARRVLAVGVPAALAVGALLLRAATSPGLALTPAAAWVEAAASGALVGALGVACVVDLARLELPDALTLGGAALALATSPFRGLGLLPSVAGTLAGLLVTYLPTLLFRLLRGREGVGGGDIKLLVLAGAWFGWEGALLVTGLGALQTVVAAAALRAAGVTLRVPEAVQREIEALRARAAAGDAAARAELDADPLAASGDAEAPMHLPMGPFLALGCVEVLAAGPALVALVRAWFLT